MGIHKNSHFVINNGLKDSFELAAYLANDSIVIYEVVRIIAKRILFLEDHLARFFASCSELNVVPRWSKQQVTDQLQLLIQSGDLENTNIKFQVQLDPRNGDQNFISFFIPHSYPTEQQYHHGVKACLLDASRTNPQAKVQNLTLRQAADEMIRKEDAYEAILTHNEYVTEGSRSNLFAIKGNVVITPQIEDVLPGVTRKHILQVCNDLKISCLQERISIEELFGMDSIFITGTSPKVLPVNLIDNQSFDVTNLILRNIMAKFDEHIDTYFQSQPILL